MTRTDPTPQGDLLNQVALRGRLAADPQTTVLPSGDPVTTFRLVVPRGEGERRPPSVDTVDCAAWRAGPRRRVAAWSAGDEVIVHGVLRRRFWRGASGLRSRYEVEVRQGRRARQ